MSIQQPRNIVDSEADPLPGLLLAAQQFAGIPTLKDGHDNLGFDGSLTQALTITLTKEAGEALGFSLSEYPSATGVFVATVVEESAAFTNGLRTNDQVLLVNEEDLSQVDRFTASAVFRSLPAGPVQIKVLRSTSTQVNLRKTLQQHIHALHNSDGKYLPGLIREQSADESIKDSTISADAVGESEPQGRAVTRQVNSEVFPTYKVQLSVNEPTKPEPNKNDTAKTAAEGTSDKPLSLAQQWVSQVARFDSLAKRNELFARPEATFGQPIFNGIFATEIILGSVIIILECITAGSYAQIISGVEYAGIAVGVFVFITGAMGLWTGRTSRYADDQRPLYWLNGSLQSICAIFVLALLAATAAMLHRHLIETQKTQIIFLPNNSTNLSVGGNELLITSQSLIGLKAAVLAIYILVFIVILIFAVAFARRKRRNASV